jgi:hypothetical protein
MPHRGIAFVVKFERLDGSAQQLVKELKVTEEHSSTAQGGVGMSLGPAICLPPGTYEITVTAFRDEPRLRGQDTRGLTHVNSNCA